MPPDLQAFLRDTFTDTKPEACATPQGSRVFIFQPFLTTLWSSQSYPIGTGTHLRGAPTSKWSPTAPGRLCHGSSHPPSPVQAHSLQGEGEVILAGLAVAHQVAGLLAQPQQRLRVRPADGPVVPAGGGRGTRCARQRVDTPGRTLPRGSSSASIPAPRRGQQPTFRERDVGGTAGVGGQGAGLPLSSSRGCRGHTQTPQLRDGWQRQAGRNAGPGKKG